MQRQRPMEAGLLRCKRAQDGQLEHAIGDGSCEAVKGKVHCSEQDLPRKVEDVVWLASKEIALRQDDLDGRHILELYWERPGEVVVRDYQLFDFRG